MKPLIVSLYLLMICQPLSAASLKDRLPEYCTECTTKIIDQTGAYILEKGEEALISRAWLTANAGHTIDVQYFIWSTDNIGILAAEALLAAAERGVIVRVIVDDLLVDAKSQTLLILAAHPNIAIKIYNPKHSVGVSFMGRIKNIFSDFHGANQRMHDKAAIFDGVVGITGGRNMADEYFDYDHNYNFRDRDILLVGKAVSDMGVNFDEFWASNLSVNVEDILARELAKITPQQVNDHFKLLHSYAKNEANFAPHVRKMLDNLPRYFSEILSQMHWGEVHYISDVPGKNDGSQFLSGGGESTLALAEQLENAKASVLIESPYLVFPKESMALLKSLRDRGVRIDIVTNSLASTDNLMAFSGYANQRKKLLKMGVGLYEFKPHPEIQRDLVARYPDLKNKNPVFAIHAKSMLIDNENIFIGTFNLDPRSANLNTEVGVILTSASLGKNLGASIHKDMLPENSWQITAQFNPDNTVTLGKRFKLWFYRVLPIGRLL